jgi:hypothetical protein
MVSLEVLVKNGFHVQPCTRKHTIIHSLQNCNFSFDKKIKGQKSKEKDDLDGLWHNSKMGPYFIWSHSYGKPHIYENQLATTSKESKG